MQKKQEKLELIKKVEYLQKRIENGVLGKYLIVLDFIAKVVISEKEGGLLEEDYGLDSPREFKQISYDIVEQYIVF